MKLDIILRTCHKEVHKIRSDGLSRTIGMSRVCGNDREKMIFKCATSLIDTINNTKRINDINLTVLDDNSDESFLNKLQKILDRCTKKTTLVNLETKGYKESAVAQFSLAAKSEDMVYTVEDDYLHETNAIDNMIVAYNYLTEKYRNDIVLYPYDCAGRYDIDREYLTILLYDGIRYWRQIRHTANTIFCHNKIFKEHYEVFKGLAENFPDLNEDHYINKLYENYEEGTGKIKVFSPIPSTAYHLSWNEPAEIKTDHLSWQHLWDRIEI